MTRSVPTSLGGVTHYGDLGANFNQGGPSVRRLPRLCWRELQPGMPQCTSLGNAFRGWMMSEVVSVQALNANALVFYRRCDSWWAVCATVAPGRLMSSMSIEMVALMALVVGGFCNCRPWPSHVVNVN
ncbi:hypothetical protein CDL15_Pgr023455 [Punica granatum]|uniref:Uncharacterized protein n=1 Tax=Punica granatum TaxID=22663 RepID=A0A218XW30_PUNGR|nr:hypothetical protein CDL15_Pgr023455 [Punica granatum]